ATCGGQNPKYLRNFLSKSDWLVAICPESQDHYKVEISSHAQYPGSMERGKRGFSPHSGLLKDGGPNDGGDG
ncbi:Hypothetical protein FKW44_007783, partial [Caligus rogercresseyi]